VRLGAEELIAETCARNCSGLRIEIDSTFAAPLSATPSGPISSLAVTLPMVPRKVEMPMYLTAKPKLEWMGSAANVPVRGAV
jgi:hypothetical protein